MSYTGVLCHIWYQMQNIFLGLFVRQLLDYGCVAKGAQRAAILLRDKVIILRAADGRQEDKDTGQEEHR